MALPIEYWTGRACGECEKVDDDCPEDREYFTTEEWEEEEHNLHCHCEDGAATFDPMDITYTVQADGFIKGLKITLATGGPHIVLVAEGRNVEFRGYWGSATVERLSRMDSDEIVEHYAECVNGVEMKSTL